jgi:hypothetical protein
LFQAYAQEEWPSRLVRRALDVGVYDYGKVKMSRYQVYYGEEAEAKFAERLMRDERLHSSNIFGQYIEREDGSVEFVREEWAIEYCPELHYVMLGGGHGFVSAYDLETLKEVVTNPSTHVYSPSGRYRFGSFDADGVRYFLEVKEVDGYVPYVIGEGTHYAHETMEGVYWVDDNTIHYLSEREKHHNDGSSSPYRIGYSMTFGPIEPAGEK